MCHAWPATGRVLGITADSTFLIRSGEYILDMVEAEIVFIFLPKASFVLRVSS